jgi:hypothetical protein
MLYWFGSYIKDHSQEEVIRQCIHSVETLTNGKLIYTKYKGQELYTNDIVLYVSKELNHWVGLWSPSTTLSVRLFARNHFSGIILDGNYLFPDPDIPVSEFFGYSLWTDGNITDWFIRNSRDYFFEREDIFDEDVVLRYLTDYHVPCKKDSSGRILMIDNPKYDMSGSHLKLVEVLGYPVNYESFLRWLKLPVSEVISGASEFLGIPYISSFFERLYFTTYLDVMHGKITDQELEFDDNIRLCYLSSLTCIPDIESIVPIPFAWVDPGDTSILQRVTDIDLYWI